MARRRNVWIPELHPRDSKGRFTKRGGGESRSSWQRAIANSAAPGVRVSRPRRGELPGGYGSIGEMLGAPFERNMELLGDPEAQGRVQAYLERTTNLVDPSSGLRVGVSKVSLGNQAMQVRYDVRDRDGVKVGSSVRIWRHNKDTGRLEIKHDYLELKERARGGGFASRWNHHNEDVYRANGAERVTLDANIDVGGYAWAKQGYDFGTVYDVENVAMRAKSVVERMEAIRAARAGSVFSEEQLSRMFPGPVASFSDAARTRFKSLLDRSTEEHWRAGTAPTPLEWAMVGWTPGATEWPGKQVMLGTSWAGVKEL